MGRIVKAGAWCNGEVAYLAWQADAPIVDCLGFMITRVHETGAEAGQRRILPTWIAFRDQSNPDWLDQDSSVWPVQQYQWRDLTLRRARDTTAVRPIDFRVHYEIVPVGLPGPGRAAVAPSPTAPFLDAQGKPRYRGPPHALAVLDAPFVTPAIDVTHDCAPKGALRATYTNGILSTQNLLQQLESLQGAKPSGVAPGPVSGITPGLLTTLKKHIAKAGDPLRRFLTADVLSFLTELLDRAEREKGEVHLALYELHDPELIARLTRLVEAGRAHVILSTAGSTDPNPAKNPPLPKKPVVWDTENHPARRGLHAASATNVQDRLFNNDQHIGHNKFAVYSKRGVAKAVLTGSTNWTETGLCTQSNNAILIEDNRVARLYLDCWKRLQADAQPPGKEVSVAVGKKTVVGFEPGKGVQGDAIRGVNAKAIPPVTLKDGKTTIELMLAPNTKAKTKSASSPTPVDLARVYALMEHANDAILFLTFLPGLGGNQNIIGQAATLAAQRPKLLVQGAISDPAALPPAVAGEPTTYTTPDGKTERLPQRAIWWPAGDKGRIAMVRAAAVTTRTGDLRPELLSAGHAIIHDKIIVIDPLDPVGCTVVTGSHNLGYKASYQNDENLLVIRGNSALAISYAVHVLDVYDHYVMRAKLEDELRNALIATGRPPPVQAGGFLDPTPAWQARWMKKPRYPTSAGYLLNR